MTIVELMSGLQRVMFPWNRGRRQAEGGVEVSNVTPKTKLLPCPFCGSQNIDKIQLSDEKRAHYIRCNTCGAVSGLWPSFRSATAGWNRRMPELLFNRVVCGKRHKTVEERNACEKSHGL